MINKFTTERRVNYWGVIKSANTNMQGVDFFDIFNNLFIISVEKISVGHMVKIGVNKSIQKTELSSLVLVLATLCSSDLGHRMAL